MNLIRLSLTLALLSACGPKPLVVDAGPIDSGAADAGTSRPWNANEVSILFPEPTDGSLLLSMRNATDAGDRYLLGEELFHRLGNPDSGLPRLAEGAGNRDVYPELRVASARVDPCFDGPDPIDGSCKRQIRLVGQLFDPTTASFSDAAIHLFYDLDAARLIDVLARIRALSRSTPVTGPLAPHPILARDALTGPFSDEIRKILLDACSTANLSRFTFMATGRSKNWFFAAFDRQADGGFSLSPIPGVTGADSFTDQGLRHYRMGIPLGVSWFPDSLLASPSTRALSAAEFATAYAQLEKLADPRVTKTRDVSCAACHAAESTEVESLADRDAGMPARPTTYRLGNLHAFSYFNGPAISARAANETDEVIRFLQSDAFLQGLSAADRARLE